MRQTSTQIYLLVLIISSILEAKILFIPIIWILLFLREIQQILKKVWNRLSRGMMLSGRSCIGLRRSLSAIVLRVRCLKMMENRLLFTKLFKIQNKELKEWIWKLDKLLMFHKISQVILTRCLAIIDRAV